jgi:prefoldin subunit 5
MANKTNLEKIVETLGKIDPSFKILNENVETVNKDKTNLDQILENVNKIETIHTRKEII